MITDASFGPFSRPSLRFTEAQPQKESSARVEKPKHSRRSSLCVPPRASFFLCLSCLARCINRSPRSCRLFTSTTMVSAPLCSCSGAVSPTRVKHTKNPEGLAACSGSSHKHRPLRRTRLLSLIGSSLESRSCAVCNARTTARAGVTIGKPARRCQPVPARTIA